MRPSFTSAKWFMSMLLFSCVLCLTGTLNAQSGLYNEAPMLADRVESGELPAVDARIPTVPMILQPVDSAGQYGGTLRLINQHQVANPGAVPAALTAGSISTVIGYEPLMRWDEQWLRPLNNLAQIVDVNEDATTYTVRLRQGVRWSDGTLFTADDLIFAMEHVLVNPEIRRSPPLWLRSGGEVATLNRVDDFTVEFQFVAPNGLFLFRLANNSGSDLTRYPMHYLQQYHPAFNEAAAEEAAAAGYETWTARFEALTSVVNTELPVITAWQVTEVGETTIVAERNPYYWKIDSDFNQLPYIDRVVVETVGTLDGFETAIQTSGDDAVLLFEDDFTRFSVDAADTSALESIVVVSSNSSVLALGLNLNHPDPALNAAFGNRDVRIALSHAINRQRMVDEIFDGNSQPYQVAPRPESPFFSEQMAYQYTEYDVDLANQMLDAAGYAERDAEGFRVDADGNRISLAFEITNDSGDTFDVLTMVVEDWRAVGIDAELIVLDAAGNDEYFTRLFAGAHDTYVSEAVGGLDVILQPSYYFPFHPFASLYASGWANWNVNPPLGMPVEPPASVQRQMELYATLQTTVDSEEQAALMAEILQIATEEFMVMGTVLDPDTRMFTSTNLRNVPAFMPQAFDFPAPAPSNPAQYYIAAEGN